MQWTGASLLLALSANAALAAAEPVLAQHLRFDPTAGERAAVRLAAPRGNVVAQVWAGFAVGESALAAGAADEAVERLTELDGLLRGVDLDVDVHPGPELAEALVLAGRVRDARPVVEAYAARAERKGQPWGRARAARARGLLAGPPESYVLFTEDGELGGPVAKSL